MAAGACGTVAVVGGGASGVLAAAHLLLRTERPLDVVILEPAARLGEGIAYSTPDPGHLLNAPCHEMSAFSDRPLDLVAWARAEGYEVSASDFLSRQLYGRYLAHVLEVARRRAGPRSGISWLHEEVVAITRRTRPDRPPFALGLGRGGHLEAGHVVLALGPPGPRPPWRTVRGSGHPGLISDPWEPGALEAVPPDGRALLLGTGLTMVDVALALAGRPGSRRLLYARSRRGLLPLAHRSEPLGPWEGRIEAAGTARELVRAVRVAAEKAEFAGGDWRSVVAAVRPAVPELWAGLSLDEQRRLLRLGLRQWEVHRHRMAPAVATALQGLRERGQLDLGRGRLRALEARGDTLLAHLERAGAEEVLEVEAIVNCTGPGAAYADGSALVRHLFQGGLARPDDLGLGLAVDGHGDLVGKDGGADRRLHTIGWARRGRLLESTAVPEIRRQAEELAGRLAGRGR